MFEEDCVGINYNQIIYTWFRTVHVLLGFELKRGPIKTVLIGLELPDGLIKFFNN